MDQAVRPSLSESIGFGTWDVPLLGSPARNAGFILFIYLLIYLE